MRVLRQPGPPHPQRIESFSSDVRYVRFTLQPGLTLNEAVTGPLAAAGFTAASVRFVATSLSPFCYVMPGPADGPDHVAYFSAPSAPAGETRIIQANATFGWADGAAFLHCHAAWTEADGRRRGGHILPHESVVAAQSEAEAWGSTTVRIAARPDPETNFTLFQPEGVSMLEATGVFARIKPNQDITRSVEALARQHGLRDAVVRGSLGSLVGARFADGRQVDDHATEVLVQEGYVRHGVATLDLLVVDMRGNVHAGLVARGENAVCITFDVAMEAG
jgi:predicted DNA-binding protein with PD1-like motif